MASYRQIYYHIVFTTKYRKETIPDDYSSTLYKYIWGIVKNKNCVLYRINGSENHIHILVDIHPTIAVSDFMKDIKVSTSICLKEQKNFNTFEGWAEGYAIFTLSHNDKFRVIEYIKSQKEHHHKISFLEEYKLLLKDFDIPFDEAKL